MNLNWRFGAALAVAVAQAGAASAGLVEEVRLGVMAHNVRVIDDKNADKEDGPNVEVEVVFASPQVLNILWSPRPYLMASGNVAGETSFGGAGLLWTWEFADGWALEPGVGYVVHSGELSNPYPNGSPEAEAFSEEHVLLGSRDLFRTSIALTKEFSDRWAGQLFFEHLSHGQILGDGRNQGLDEAGVRVAYRFGK